MKRAAALLLSLSLSGCLAKSLRGPAEDHYIQTATISKRVDAGAYAGDAEALAEDLAAMAKQACLIDAIVKAEKPDEHCGEAGDE